MFSGVDIDGKAFTDCFECKKGANGDLSCSPGSKVKSVMQGMCFYGELLDEYKRDDNKITLIFFDTETNGMSSNNSVLSITAMKAQIDKETFEIEVLEEFTRYYFAVEPYNQGAISVNGLTYNKVMELRRENKSNYANYFKDDTEDLDKFFGDAKHFIAHNIDFDSRFIKRSLDYKFCTMKLNTSKVGIYNPYKGNFKWPKLLETAKHYGINIQEEKLHMSSYDVELTVEVFKKMLEDESLSTYIKNFVLNNQSCTNEI